MNSRHEMSSGENPDSTIYHCRACGWRSEVAPRGFWPGSNRCQSDDCPTSPVVSYIDFHRATETQLVERILAGKA